MSVFNPLVRILLRTLSPVYRPGGKVKVVLFHHARTGSTVVNSMLRQHKNVYWAGEILRRGVLQLTSSQSFDFKEYLAQAEYASMRPVYGIEIKFADMKRLQVPYAEMLTYLQEKGYQYILLRRLNILRQLISMEVKKAAGFAHLQKTKSTHLRQVTIDTDTLISRIQRVQNEIDELQQLVAHVPHLELTYETDIENDPSIAYRKICSWLHLTPGDVLPGLKRINPFPVREILLNFDQVALTLQNTPYAWMLEDAPRATSTRGS